MKKQPSQSKQKPPAKVQSTVKTAEPKIIGPSLFERFESFAVKNEKWLMISTFIFSVICSILLFDLKMSIGGDDSAYVERAYNFIKKGTYPYYQSPGYPLMLATLMKIFGYKISVLKIFSLIFYTGHIVLTWYAFRKRIPYMILVFMVGFAVVSDYMQYYASQTWSEAFYMFVQALVLWVVMKIVSLEKYEGSVLDDLKKHWYLWLGVGVAFTLLTMTKTIAIFSIGAPVLYFIIQKKYRFAIYIAVSFLVIKLGVGQIETSVYGPNTSNQLEQMMYKDGYKNDQGKLSAIGFMERYFENLKTYSSMHFFRFIHVIPQNQYKLSEDGSTLEEEKQLAGFITFFITALILYGSYRIFRADKKAFFLVLFTLIMASGIFFGIHANNRQDRLIIILFPFILMIIGYGLYLTAKNFRALQGIVIGLFAILLLSSFYHTLSKAPESVTALQKNMGGDKRYGYTQDWVNYLEMGDWCAENLPEGSIVLCRKSEIMFTNTFKQMWYQVSKIDSKKVTDENGREVEVPIEDGEYYIKKYKEAKVTHILVADLRAIPMKKSNRIISTIHKVGNFIVRKYPNMLKPIKVIGADEKAMLYEIRYQDYGF